LGYFEQDLTDLEFVVLGKKIEIMVIGPFRVFFLGSKALGILFWFPQAVGLG
jgi:hypothetical protein